MVHREGCIYFQELLYVWQEHLIVMAWEVCLLSLTVLIIEDDKDIAVIQLTLRKLKLFLPILYMTETN